MYFKKRKMYTIAKNYLSDYCPKAIDCDYISGCGAEWLQFYDSTYEYLWKFCHNGDYLRVECCLMDCERMIHEEFFWFDSYDELLIKIAEADDPYLTIGS